MPDKKRLYAIFTVNDKNIRTGTPLNTFTIDAPLSFKDHLRNAGLKASKVTRALAGSIPNIGETNQPRWFHLSSMVYSVILYRAPIWADAISSYPSYGVRCRRGCRTIALRVACAYHTVSHSALCSTYKGRSYSPLLPAIKPNLKNYFLRLKSLIN